MQLKSMAAVALASGIVSSSMAADAVQWRVEDGGNGHWYQAIPAQDWFAASASASATNAHLASILSSAENSFVTSILASTTAFRGYIGLEQLPGQPLPNVGWRWATGELVGFSNWTDFGGSYSFVAPDDTPCNIPPYFVEDGQADIGMIALDGKWDDLERGQLACNIPWTHVAILEWSTDCNNDGIVDYGQCRDGSLVDSNANNVPDICEFTSNFEILAVAPDPTAVYDPSIRAAIAASGYPWMIRDVRTGIEFVLVPAGSFTMGSTPLDVEATADEQPAHLVTLTRPFYIGRTEVTQAQWFAMTATAPSYFGGRPSNPVERVSWNMSVAAAGTFGYRLPTEAEWEYACRGGSTASRYGPLNDIAWWGNGSGGSSGWGTNPVATKAANGFGLHDMIGNVWEHCQDNFAAYGPSPLIDPTGPVGGLERVNRGGDWFWPAVGNRAPYRLGVAPEYVGLASTGVRFALAPESTSLFDGSAIPDCNGDGIADYGQCHDGSLPDYNVNSIPDCCENGTNCVVGSYPVQWRVEDGGNGHWYTTTSHPLVFQLQRQACEARGGHLATLTSESEWAWVKQRLPVAGFFVGGYQDRSSPSYAEPNGGWKWVTGEPFVLEVGYMGTTTIGCNMSEPGFDDCPGGTCGSCGCGAPGAQDALFYTGCCNGVLDDVGDGVTQNCDSEARRGVIEWSADCNADGIVDYGQILRGELGDTNANGVPDACESTILVPSQFPTIQAAIDSVPAGTQRTVQVAAGTYNESFSLNGKNVVIRGAANNATILDGTGLPASIATFTGGEPATAGLESLVFRNATVGSLIYKGALFKVGGAVYGRDSSAFIRDCRFEGNRSDYGGGAYLLYCNMLVEGCVFTGNTGIAQGGGLMVFGTTGTVRNCTFIGNQCGIAGIGGGSAFKAAGTLLTGEQVLLDGCQVTNNTAGVEGGAVEYYENVELNPGTLRIVNSTITGNRSGGSAAPAGAGGLMITGRMQSCIVGEGTVLCDNLPRNIEGAFFISGAPSICDCLADLNGDAVVSGGDLGLLLNAWGATASSGAGDVNHDGQVDGADLALMLNSWGSCD
jgi:formylglycine-generating enzyme required for sulfatase activity